MANGEEESSTAPTGSNSGPKKPGSTPPATEEYVSYLPTPQSIESLVTDFPEELAVNIKPKYLDTENNAWYPLVTMFISTLSDECIRHSSMHAESSKLYNKYYQIITIALIIIPLFSGLISLLPLGGTVGNYIKNIGQGVIALILTALGGLNKLMKYSEKSQLHRLASNKYMKLNGQISEQLSLPVDKRENGIVFEKWCRGIFFSIKEIAPYPNKRFTKELQTKAPDTPSSPSPSQPAPPGRPPMPTEGGDVTIPIPPEGGGEPVTSIPLDAFPKQTQENAYLKYIQSRGKRLGVFMGEHDSPII